MTQRLRVQFLVDVPDDMSLAQAREWIGFEVGAVAQMSYTHPQMDRYLDPIPGSFDVSLAPLYRSGSR